MSEQWANIVADNAALLTRAIEKLAATEQRERDLRAALASIAEQATQQYEMTTAGRVLRQIEQCARRALEGPK